ncbi:pep-cterm sorting domain-containing protein [Anaeramoeba ignava]|uniref:Pep-cterm sorting domain-containing protein n=1 Tax=Anaeramoeba ignava TaxID=1746090 RepID=A0A9Q0RGX7_ANAIG|nr:pep-cterm sorting domain-containing protein [Anaeramoeba ignava]
MNKQNWSKILNQEYVRDFERLMEKESTNSNFKIIVGNEKMEFGCSKLILFYRSSFFTNYLTHNETDQVFFPDISPVVMPGIIRYIYTSRITVPTKWIIDFYYAICKFQFNELRNLLFNWIMDHLNSETVLQWFDQIATLKSQPLLQKCFSIISENLPGVFFQEAFLTLKEDSLISILDQFKNSIEFSKEILNCLANWVDRKFHFSNDSQDSKYQMEITHFLSAFLKKIGVKNIDNLESIFFDKNQTLKISHNPDIMECAEFFQEMVTEYDNDGNQKLIFRSQESGIQTSKIINGSMELLNCLKNWLNKDFFLASTLCYSYSPIAEEKLLTKPDFHKWCDNKGPTLVIILTTKGMIFGGYTSVGWKNQFGNCKYFKDSQSFLFSLINPSKKMRKFPIKPGQEDYAVYFDKNLGPVFGFGHDLYVEQSIISGFSNCGFSYYDNVDSSNQQEISVQFFSSEQSYWEIQYLEVYTLL